MATIRKRGAKWQAQIRRQGCPPVTKSFFTKDDALRWSREHERLIDRGETLQVRVAQSLVTPTVTDLLDRYEAEVAPGKRSGSDRFLLRQIRRHSTGRLGADQLTSAHVAQYRDDRLKTVSGSTVRKELALLAHVLKVACDEWCVRIATESVKAVRKPPAGRGRDRRLKPEELGQLKNALRSCRNPIVEQVFLFALATGMRRGEALSLKWRNVDLHNRTALLPLTKNGEARVVPLSPAALSVLARLNDARQQPPEALAAGSCDSVFPISANALRLSWERVKRRAGITDLRFHDLRHEAISRFFEVGLSVPEVALISGHKDARMLFRYTHLRADAVAAKLASQSDDAGKQQNDP